MIVVTFDKFVQKLHGVVRPLSLKTDVIKKRFVCSLSLFWTILILIKKPGFWYSKRHCSQRSRRLAQDSLVVN